MSFFEFWSDCSGWERLGLVCTFAVVLGVIGEVVLIFKRFPYNPTSFPPLEKSKKKFEIIFAGLVAVGVAGELFATIKALPESHREISGLKQEATSNAVEVARLTLINSLVTSNVVALELKMLEASNAIVKMDLAKRPLWSVMAFVSLRYKTDDAVLTDLDLITSNMPPVMDLHGKYSFGPTMRLLPDRPFDSFPEGAFFGDGTPRKPDNWAMVLEFSWHPYFMNTNSFDTNNPVEFATTAEHWTAAQFAETVMDFELFPRLPYKTEILSGRIEVIYNWSIWKEFNIPHQWVGWGSGINGRAATMAAFRDKFLSGQIIKDRTISPEREKQIITKLKGALKPRQVSISFDSIEGDEPQRYSEILKKMLENAGYNVLKPAKSAPHGGRGVPTGIQILVGKSDPESVYGPLAQALYDAGIFSEVGKALNTNDVPDNVMNIHVFGGP